MTPRSRHSAGSFAAVAIALLLAPGALRARPAAGQAPAATTPSLVVVLVVDQLRSDYLERYGGLLSSGLRRLMRDGAWFSNAAYPYLNTVTCAGHSTIGTGSFPYRHGMILNGWYDREAARSSFCTEDPTVRDVSYSGLPPGRGNSARRLMLPSLGEEIRQRGGRSVAISLKPRSAIPLAGHGADVVIWFDERGGWSTSTAYSQAPVPVLKRFIEANPVAADYDKVWTRTREPGAYAYDDDARGEGTTGGWTRTFPHPLGSPEGRPDATFYARWQRSPFADEYLGRLAAAALDGFALGRRPTTDFLAVSFSSLDLVGHAFGPRSHEVQDLLARLDATVARLLDHLDRTVGSGKYIVALSADHGVAEIPDQIDRGGRLSGWQLSDVLNTALAGALGPGRHVLSTAYTDVYLAAAARNRIRSDRKIRALARETLLALPAIGHVFDADELVTASARRSPDPVKRAAALSYFPGRSGDLVVAPREHWLLSTSTTTHGTHYGYDQRVPVIFFGASVNPGKHADAVTPADIPHTLGAIAGVRMADGDGHVLGAIIAQAPRRLPGHP